MLKTAIIGAGVISHPHIMALHELGIGIAGILDVDITRAQALASQCESKAIQSLDEVLLEIDMVHIFTPPFNRVEYVKQAAKAGKHIYIEKPIAISISDAKEIIDLAEINNVKLMVGFNQRFRKGFKMLQNAVDDGQLGDIVSVFFNRYSIGGGQRINSSWRTNPDHVCGMSIESLSHDIDMLLHLVDGVTSISANVFGTIPELSSFDNNVSVSLRLKNGGIGMLNASWSSYLSYSSRGVIGTKGSAMIVGDDSFNFLDFIVKTNDMPYERITKINDRLWVKDGDYIIDSYLTVNGKFKECIENDHLPPSTGTDGLKALYFSQAILESSRTGQAITVNL